MKNIFFLWWICSGLSVGAQSINGRLTVFNTGNDRFTVFLNGVQKNNQPQNKVEINGLLDLFYNVKIVFENPALHSISRSNVAVSDGDDNLMDVQYKLFKGTDQYKLRFYSMNPMHETNATQVHRNQIPEELLSETIRKGALSFLADEGDNFFLYIGTQQINTVAQSKIRVEGLEQLFYPIRIVFANNKLGFIQKSNLSVSDGDDNLMDVTYKVSRSGNSNRLRFYSINPVRPNAVVVPGTYVYSWGSQTRPVYVDEVKSITNPAQPASPVAQTVPASQPEPVVPTKPVASKPEPVVPEKSTFIREPDNWTCSNEWPMWKLDFQQARTKMSALKSVAEKMTQAEQVIANNCLNTDQVIELARLFEAEADRLALVKKAFPRTIDYKNYNRAASLFTGANLHQFNQLIYAHP
jgi:hypothetical protein